MIPSDALRKEISKNHGIDLDQYAWPEDFKKHIFSIKLDKDLEVNADTLEDIYIHGFNIGRCGLTSRYITREFENACLYYGKAKLLVGTKNSPDGEHAWTCINDLLIDSTLMICIPESKAKDFGYIPQKKIAYDSARMLSEFDVFDREFENTNNKDNSVTLKSK